MSFVFSYKTSLGMQLSNTYKILNISTNENAVYYAVLIFSVNILFRVEIFSYSYSNCFYLKPTHLIPSFLGKCLLHQKHADRRVGDRRHSGARQQTRRLRLLHPHLRRHGRRLRGGLATRQEEDTDVNLHWKDVTNSLVDRRILDEFWLCSLQHKFFQLL